MATTFVEYTGDGNATKQFTFPSYQESDVKVRVDNVLKTTSTHYNITGYTTTGGGNVVFTAGNIPSNPALIRIYRDTSVDVAKATYTAGSSVKAADLNNNNTQLLYRAQEEQVPNLIQTYDIVDNILTTSKIVDGAVTSAKIADGAIVDGDINASANINGSKLLNDSVALTKLGSGALPTDITVASANIVNGTIVDADIATGTLDNRYYTETELDAGQLDNRYYTETELNAGQLDNRYYTETELNAGQLDNRYYTETELLNGALDGRYFTETEAEAKYFNINTGETIKRGDLPFPDNDTTIATTAAINDRIIDLVDDVGGFVPLANETSFPTANPDVNDGTGTLLSIKALSQNLTSNNSGSITIANAAGGATVTIGGAPANTTFPAGFGMIVETKTTTNQYTFHRLVPKATEVTAVAGSIGNVNTVAGEISPTNNISAVAGVADNLSAFNATFRGQVTTVANDATDIGAVAGKETEIGRLGTAEAVADLAILGTTAAVADMAIIADTANLISNIGTVAGIHGNVTSVANNETNINAVKNNETNINAVKNNESNINSAVFYASNINTVASQLGASGSVTTVATNITNVNNASTYLNNFLALYLGEAATPPSVDTFGNPVTEGDFYFNTVNKQLQVFNGSAFTSIFAFDFTIEKAATAAFNALYTAAAGQNSINLGGLAITGAVFGDEKIATNRISLTKGSATYNLGGIT